MQRSHRSLVRLFEGGIVDFKMNVLHTAIIAILATSAAAGGLRADGNGKLKGAHFFSFAQIAEMKKGTLDPKVAVVGTNFDVPVQVPLRNKKACNGCEPMPFDEMLPIERKVMLAQHALDRLNMARSIEENALKIRLKREREETDAAIKRKIQLKEKYLNEKEKIHELESKIESAKVTAARREQLLTDPNKFTDKCSPGFRVYWVGQSEGTMSWDDKKVMAKVLKDQYCNVPNMACVCDLSKKQAHSVLGTVNAGLGCKCYEGVAKQVVEAQKAEAAEKEEMEGESGASGASGPSN